MGAIFSGDIKLLTSEGKAAGERYRARRRSVATELPAGTRVDQFGRAAVAFAKLSPGAAAVHNDDHCDGRPVCQTVSVPGSAIAGCAGMHSYSHHRCALPQ